MSNLKEHLASIGIILGLATGHMCLAQNGSFPDDITIRRNTNFSNNSTNSQYLVYVPDPTNLPKVKTLAPDAFVSSLNSGERVIQVGRFSNIEFAQRRAEELKRGGLNAKVQATSPAIPPTIPAPSPTLNPTFRPEALPDVPPTPTVNRNINGTATALVSPPEVVPLPAPPSVTETLTAKEATRNRYFVIIPSTIDSVLAKARTIVPSARLNSTDRGTYIEVQGYPDRPSAEALNASMRSQGLDSRVIYF